MCLREKSAWQKALRGSPEHHLPSEGRLEEGRGAQPGLRQKASSPPRAQGLLVSALRKSLVPAPQQAEAAEEPLRLGAAGPWGLSGWCLGSSSAHPHPPALGLSTGVLGCCFLWEDPGPRLSPAAPFRWLPQSSWQPFEVPGGGCPALTTGRALAACRGSHLGCSLSSLGRAPPLAAEAGCLSLELETWFWETDLKIEEQIPFCWGGWLLRVSSGDLCKPEGALGSPVWSLLVCALCFCYTYSFCQGLQVP